MYAYLKVSSNNRTNHNTYLEKINHYQQQSHAESRISQPKDPKYKICVQKILKIFLQVMVPFRIKF